MPAVAPEIIPVVSADLIAQCHPVMLELRPHFSDAALFRAQVERQQSAGYSLVCGIHDGLVRTVAGFWVRENLPWGRHVYVDDLVTRSADHGKGLGSALFDWLVAEARRRNCAQIHLDSGVQRFGAHRFYLHKGMNITCHHFALPLSHPC